MAWVGPYVLFFMCRGKSYHIGHMNKLMVGSSKTCVTLMGPNTLLAGPPKNVALVGIVIVKVNK